MPPDFPRQPVSAHPSPNAVSRFDRTLHGAAAIAERLPRGEFDGISEHSAAVRRRVCEAAVWLGVELDEPAKHAQALLAAGSGE